MASAGCNSANLVPPVGCRTASGDPARCPRQTAEVEAEDCHGRPLLEPMGKPAERLSPRAAGRQQVHGPPDGRIGPTPRWVDRLTVAHAELCGRATEAHSDVRTSDSAKGARR